MCDGEGKQKIDEILSLVDEIKKEGNELLKRLEKMMRVIKLN